MAEAQNDPLLPGYSFNAHLVAGLTPIEANGYLDFFIDRPLGMKGYILNLTIRGQGVVKNQGREFVCRPGDILLFPPERFITTVVIRRLANGITSGFTFVRAPTGMNGLTGRQYLPIRGSFARMKRTSRISATCLGKSLTPGKGRALFGAAGDKSA